MFSLHLCVCVYQCQSKMVDSSSSSSSSSCFNSILYNKEKSFTIQYSPQSCCWQIAIRPRIRGRRPTALHTAPERQVHRHAGTYICHTDTLFTNDDTVRWMELDGTTHHDVTVGYRYLFFQKYEKKTST